DRLPRIDAGAPVYHASLQPGHGREYVYSAASANQRATLAPGSDRRLAQSAGPGLPAGGWRGDPQRSHKFAARGAGRVELYLLASSLAWNRCSGSRLVLRHAVQRTQPQHEITAWNADDFAIREQSRERVQRDAVLGIAKNRREHQAIRNVEVGVAC